MAKSLQSHLEDLFSDRIREQMNKEVNKRVQQSSKYTAAQKQQISANLTADERNKPKFSEEARIQEEARRRIEEQRLRQEQEFRAMQEDRNRQYQADLARRRQQETDQQLQDSQRRQYRYTYGADTVLGQVGAKTQSKQGVDSNAVQQAANTAVQDIRNGTDALSREVYGQSQPDTNPVQAAAFHVGQAASDTAKKRQQQNDRAALARNMALLEQLNTLLKTAEGERRAELLRQIASVRSAGLQTAKSIGAIYNSATGKYELMSGQVIEPEYDAADPQQSGGELTPTGADTQFVSPAGQKDTAFNRMAKSTEQIGAAALGAVQDIGNATSGGFYSVLADLFRFAGARGQADALDEQAEYSYNQDLFGADRWKRSIDERYNWDQNWIDKASTMLNEGAGYMLPSIAGGALAQGAAAAGGLGQAGGLLSAATNSGNAGLAIMASQVYGQSTQEALNDGATIDQAQVYGALSAIASVATERIAGGIPMLQNGGIADDLFGKVVKNPKLQRAAGVVVDLLGEGAEEAIESVLEPVWQRMTYNPDADWTSPEEIAESFGTGVLLSALMMGGYYAGSKAADRMLGIVSDSKYRKIMKQIQPNHDTYTRLVDAGFSDAEIAETAIYTAVQRGELDAETADAMLTEVRSEVANNAPQAAQERVKTAEPVSSVAEANVQQSASEANSEDVQTPDVFEDDSSVGVRSRQENNAGFLRSSPDDIDPVRTRLGKDGYEARLYQAVQDGELAADMAERNLDIYRYERGFPSEGTYDLDDALAQFDGSSLGDARRALIENGRRFVQTSESEYEVDAPEPMDAEERAERDAVRRRIANYRAALRSNAPLPRRYEGSSSVSERSYENKTPAQEDLDSAADRATQRIRQEIKPAYQANALDRLDDLLAGVYGDESDSGVVQIDTLVDEMPSRWKNSADQSGSVNRSRRGSEGRDRYLSIVERRAAELNETHPIQEAYEAARIKIDFNEAMLSEAEADVMIELSDRVYRLEQERNRIVREFSGDGRALVTLTKEERETLERAVVRRKPEIIWRDGYPKHLELMLELYPVEVQISCYNKPIARYRVQQFEALHNKAKPFTEHIDRANDRGRGIYYQRRATEKVFADIYRDNPELYKRFRAEYLDPMHEHERAATDYKNKYRDSIRETKLNKYERAAVQMLLDDNTELYAEYHAEHGKQLNEEKIRSAVDICRNIFDEVHRDINTARVANGYETIGKIEHYSPHFYAPEGTLTKLVANMLGRSSRVDSYDPEQLPTAIAGTTETRRPNQRWARHAQTRMGENTDYDIYEAFDQYIDEFADVIFLTQDIRKFRAYEENIRYGMADAAARAEIDRINMNFTINHLQRELLIDNELSGTKADLMGARVIEKLIGTSQPTGMENFVVWLRDWINTNAGKKTFTDRGIEHTAGRGVYSKTSMFFNRLNKNLVGSVSSLVTNVLPGFQIMGELGHHAVFAYVDMAKNFRSDDGFVQRSDFLTTRRGSDRLNRGAFDKAFDFFGFLDDFGSEAVTRAYYRRNLAKGMTPADAMIQAGYDAADMLGTRSKVSMPMLYRHKNPIWKTVSSFQLEVDNAFQHIATLAKEHGVFSGKFVLKMMGLAFATALINEGYERLFGYDPLLDPLDWIEAFIGAGDDDEEAGFGDRIVAAGKSVAEDLPFVGGLIGGGRVPITGAIPGGNLLEFGDVLAEMFSGDTTNRRRRELAVDELSKIPAMLIAPAFGSQMRKTASGINAVLDGGIYSVDSDGNEQLRAPVDSNVLNLIQAAISGKYALGDVRGSFDGDAKLNAGQTRVYEAIRNGEANYGISAYDFAKMAQEYNAEKKSISTQFADDNDAANEARSDLMYETRRKIAVLDVDPRQKMALDAALIGQKYGSADDDVSRKFGQDTDDQIALGASYDIDDPAQLDAALWLRSKCSDSEYRGAMQAVQDGVSYIGVRDAFRVMDGIDSPDYLPNAITGDEKNQVYIYSKNALKAESLFKTDLSAEEKVIVASDMISESAGRYDFSSEERFYLSAILSDSYSSSKLERYDGLDTHLNDSDTVVKVGELLTYYWYSYKGVDPEKDTDTYEKYRYWRNLINQMDVSEDQAAELDYIFTGENFGKYWSTAKGVGFEYEDYMRGWNFMSEHYYKTDENGDYVLNENGNKTYYKKSEMVAMLQETLGFSYSEAVNMYNLKRGYLDKIGRISGGRSGYRRYSRRRRYSSRGRSGRSGGNSGGSGSGLGGRKFGGVLKGNPYKLGSFLKDYSYRGLFDLDF